MKMQSCPRPGGGFWYWEPGCSIQPPDPIPDGIGETIEEAKVDYHKCLITFKSDLQDTMRAVDKVLGDYENWEES